MDYDLHTGCNGKAVWLLVLILLTAESQRTENEMWWFDLNFLFCFGFFVHLFCIKYDILSLRHTSSFHPISASFNLIARI